MNNGILVVLFELQVFLLEIIKVVVEVKAGEIVSKLVLWLVRYKALFDLLFLNLFGGYQLLLKKDFILIKGVDFGAFLVVSFFQLLNFVFGVLGII